MPHTHLIERVRQYAQALSGVEADGESRFMAMFDWLREQGGGPRIEHFDVEEPRMRETYSLRQLVVDQQVIVAHTEKQEFHGGKLGPHAQNDVIEYVGIWNRELELGTPAQREAIARCRVAMRQVDEGNDLQKNTPAAAGSARGPRL